MVFGIGNSWRCTVKELLLQSAERLAEVSELPSQVRVVQLPHHCKHGILAFLHCCQSAIQLLNDCAEAAAPVVACCVDLFNDLNEIVYTTGI